MSLPGASRALLLRVASRSTLRARLPAGSRTLATGNGFQGWGDLAEGAPAGRQGGSAFEESLGSERAEAPFRPRRESGGYDRPRGFAGGNEYERPRGGGQRPSFRESRGPIEPRAGDWVCSCGAPPNFASRSECRVCGEPKPENAAAPPAGAYERAPREPREGGRPPQMRWVCTSCQMDNLPFRTECFKCEVRAARGAATALRRTGTRVVSRRAAF